MRHGGWLCEDILFYLGEAARPDLREKKVTD